MDLDGGDDVPLTYPDNDYHLTSDSPCIDSGRNESWMWRGTDLDGNNRIFYGADSATVDMGAYEYGSLAFRTLRILRAADGKTTLTWCSRPGDTYVVWSCESISSDLWSNIATIASQGAVTSWTDAASSARLRFYRIEMK